jgi:hypothetical protein
MVLKFKDGEFEYHEPPYTEKEKRALDRSFNRGPWTTMWRRGPEIAHEASQPPKLQQPSIRIQKTGSRRSPKR